MPLTVEQYIVATKLQTWFEDSSRKAIRLEAKGGAGKTFVLTSWVSELKSVSPITFVATTHAALEQLKQKIKDPKRYRWKTVSSCVGDYPVQKDSQLELRFANHGKAPPLKGLVIVDESSMLGADEVLWFLNNCGKVVFSGDQNQLKPVKKTPGRLWLDTLETLTIEFNFRAQGPVAAAGYNALVEKSHVPETSECKSVTAYESLADLRRAFLWVHKHLKDVNPVWITRTNADADYMNSLVIPRGHLIIGDKFRLSRFDTISTAVVIAEAIKPHKWGQRVRVQGTWLHVATKAQWPQVQEALKETTEKFQEIEKKPRNAYTRLELQRQLKLRKHLKMLRAIIPVSWPWAITVYKSQGATIEHAFVNTVDLEGQSTKYVAYSRASQALYVREPLADNSKIDPLKLKYLYWFHAPTGFSLEGVTGASPHLEIRDAIKTQFPELAVPLTNNIYNVKTGHMKSVCGWYLAQDYLGTPAREVKPENVFARQL